MSSKTKIIVLRMKEIIYTGIFLGLAVLLIALCLIMFRRKLHTRCLYRFSESWQPGCQCAGGRGLQRHHLDFPGSLK